MPEETNSTAASLQLTKTKIVRLSTANIVFRTVSLSLSIYGLFEFSNCWLGIFSLPFIIVYLTIETLTFFCCSISCWPVNIIFQVTFILHDFAYFLAVTVLISTELGRLESKTLDYVWAALLFVNGVIQIALTIYFSKLPKRSCFVKITDTSSEIYPVQPDNTQQVLVRTENL